MVKSILPVIFGFLIMIPVVHAVTLEQREQYFRDYKNSIIEPTIKGGGDAYATDLMAQLSVKQTGYLALFGRYWQAPSVFNIPPSGLSEPDVRRSLNDDFDWVDFGLDMPSFTRYNTRIDVYDSPVCDGFVLFLQTQNPDGAYYQRTIDYGCEDWRTSNWHLFIP